MSRKKDKKRIMIEWGKFHQETLDKIQNFCLMDDLFMTYALKNDPKAVECILRIILQDDQIQVVSVHVQDVFPNLYGRGVRLDVHAIDRNGRHFDIEIQKAKEGVNPRRSRHNGAILDMENVPKGKDPIQLPETYIIFVCEHDPFRKGLPVYTVEKQIKETGEAYDDGMHYVFANTEYFEDDDFGKLAKDLKEKDPEKINFTPLASAVARAKNDQEGVSGMCQIMEDWRDELTRESRKRGREEGRAETIVASVKAMVETLGLSADQALAALKIPDADRSKYKEALGNPEAFSPREDAKT